MLGPPSLRGTAERCRRFPTHSGVCKERGVSKPSKGVERGSSGLLPFPPRAQCSQLAQWQAEHANPGGREETVFQPEEAVQSPPCSGCRMAADGHLFYAPSSPHHSPHCGCVGTGGMGEGTGLQHPPTALRSAVSCGRRYHKERWGGMARGTTAWVVPPPRMELRAMRVGPCRCSASGEQKD